MESVRLFNREVKVQIHSDQEAWDLYKTTVKRLGSAACERARLSAERDEQAVLAVCVARGILVDPWEGYDER